MSETPAAPPSAFEPLPRRELTLVIAGIMLTLMLASLDQNIVSTALPRIVGDLGGLSHLSWVVTAFVLTSTVSTPLYGKLSDMYGRRRLFHVSIAVFLAGSILCGAAQSMTQLILFRAVQGIGAGGLLPLSQTAMGDVVEPRERGRYQGLFTGVFAFCSVAGPLLGGIITVALNWRWIFFVNLPVGAVAIFLIEKGFPRQRKMASHNIDYAGAGLLTTGTTALLLMLSWGGAIYSWGSTIILAMAAATAILYAGFIARQSLAYEPLLPLRLFRVRSFGFGCVAMGLNAMALFGAAVFMPLFFQLVMGADPAQAGLRMAALMGGVIVASVVGGQTVTRLGRYKYLLCGGLACSTGGFLLMGFAAAGEWGLTAIEGFLVLIGLGIGLAMPNLTLAIQNSVERHELGIATSTLGFFRSLGGAIGVALSGAIMTASLHALLPADLLDPTKGAALDQGIDKIMSLPDDMRIQVIATYRHAIVDTIYTGAVFAGLAFAVSLLLPDKRLRGREADLQKGQAAVASASE